MRTRLPTLVALGLLGLPSGCGRSWVYDETPTPTLKPCSLQWKPAAIDFGLVGLNTAVSSRLLLWNGGGTTCQLSDIALGSGTDPLFELPAAQPNTLSIEPGEDASLDVDFDAASIEPPTLHTGTLDFLTGDPANPNGSVPLSATVHTVCTLQVTPASIDYGTVAIGNSATQSATLTDVGSAPCEVTQLAVGGDPEFALASGQPTTLTLQVGGSAAIPVTFDATDRTPPHQKTGTLTLQTGDPANPKASIPLTANVDVGCQLAISPNPLDFGNLTLNATATDPLTLQNTGTQVCTVTQIALGAGTDIDFSLPTPPTSLTIAVGASAQISVTFDAANPPPDERTGTLTFVTNDATNTNASVPLMGNIDTNCTSAGLLIYVVDQNDEFSTFNPETLTFKDLGLLSCPDPGGSPFSMAVDQNAIAWVLYSDGNIFRVDPATLDCTATSFVPGQDGLNVFGMGFSFDPASNTDTLFVAGGINTGSLPVTLASIAFPSLSLSPVVNLTQGWPELTGTGDGQLWGFFPNATGASGFISSMVQIDKQTGATLQTLLLPSISEQAQDWAVGFFGGAFWAFLASGQQQGATTNVYEIQRSDGTLTTALTTTRNIVGAGVSTCAPVN